ncbi:1-acyl-sn-glycerol-3-phosphate acyltransferase [Allomuricauda sp. d1]|uniref:1-acyl-sn-glycerol-3-phosphate acyltransferase n=1 Tax=Allomuricauda sp. d1 TaxID=3136725 RepID=UPI0031D47C2F
MKQLGYYFFKYWALCGLNCYYRRIKTVGLENIPKDKPVLFLSNHQNALMDVLLIATLSKRKPWYLTRADVFKSPFFRPLFHFLQMLPIYRIRDGKQNLFRNNAVFDKCGEILCENGAILIFPEANHDLRRRVRPLSKGFTRIIENALENNPEMDLQLIPVGQNYQNATEMGDAAALYFGKPIPLKKHQGTKLDSLQLRAKVFERLKKLTTHIEPDDEYDEKLARLMELDPDFTNPIHINAFLRGRQVEQDIGLRKDGAGSFLRFLFYSVNLPLVFLWRLLLKPKVPEPEFMATYRFGFGMLVYPLFYLFIGLVLARVFEWKTACVTVILHAVLNFLLLKTMAPTSSVRRK